VPKVWIFVDELPINNSGKVQKFVLRDRYKATQAAGAPAPNPPPRSDY
jgi:acyl-coenzyme A synthetase/AMP-(fatty) acid ligase